MDEVLDSGELMDHSSGGPVRTDVGLAGSHLQVMDGGGSRRPSQCAKGFLPQRARQSE